jgi:hypothetical protein
MTDYTDIQKTLGERVVAKQREASAKCAPEPAARKTVAPDPRYGALLGTSGWQRLPHAIRERFAERPESRATVTYCGAIVQSRRTRPGKLLAQLCRFMGAPLPLTDDVDLPAVVAVVEDGATGGQIWTRIYARKRGFPQVIQSRKRFCGPTGLEEYLGRGFGIALTVSADPWALHFHSDHYFLRVGAIRLRLPAWLAPGALTISHVECGDGWFAFVLGLRHPLLGEVIRQTALFRERIDPHLGGDRS